MLGEIPHWRCTQRGWLLLMREFQSHLSALANSFIFRKRVRPSLPHVLFLPGTCEEKTAGQRIRAAGDKRAHVGQTPDSERTRSLCVSKTVNELWLKWSLSEEPSRCRLDEWSLPGHHQAPRQRSSPFFSEVHDELTKSWHAPYSSRIRPSASAALTSVDGAEEKGYECLSPLDESGSIGWKVRASHPSKPCRITSALAGCAYSAAGQAALALHSMAVL